MSLLALVMIVRDEAAVLPGFFRHHAGLWDEAVVVDTGSRDGTPAVAREAGARVLHAAWDDDFAAPRNLGLEAARAPVVLLLDADERVAARDFATVREAAAQPAPCAWLQETLNYCDERAHLEWRPVRGRYPLEEAGHTGYFSARRVGLFPRRDDVRFRGRIHETVLPDCERAGFPVRPLAVPVHHYGYVRSTAVDERRRGTYERLAARKLVEAPDDPAALLEHATALLEGGRAAEALAPLARLAAGDGRLRPVARGRYLLARLRREAGDPAAAGELLEAAVRDDPAFLFAWVERVRLLMVTERWREVAAALAAARAACGGDEPLLDREELVALVRTGRLDEARAVAARLATTCPAWPEIAALRDRLEAAGGGRTGAS
jgi:hypothetical protein